MAQRGDLAAALAADRRHFAEADRVPRVGAAVAVDRADLGHARVAAVGQRRAGVALVVRALLGALALTARRAGLPRRAAAAVAAAAVGSALLARALGHAARLALTAGVAGLARRAGAAGA